MSEQTVQEMIEACVAASAFLSIDGRQPNDTCRALDAAAATLRELLEQNESDTPDLEWEQIPPFEPTVRCPVCRTHGHEHRKDCKYAGTGMSNHVRIRP